MYGMYVYENRMCFVIDRVRVRVCVCARALVLDRHVVPTEISNSYIIMQVAAQCSKLYHQKCTGVNSLF
jgi:hypothetical protein